MAQCFCEKYPRSSVEFVSCKRRAGAFFLENTYSCPVGLCVLESLSIFVREMVGFAPLRGSESDPVWGVTQTLGRV